jgi:hypothetical protein
MMIAAEIEPREASISGGKLELSLPAQGLAVIEIR